MRIGLLTTSFPRTHDDIAGAFVLGFARALAAHGHELDVLAPEPAESGQPLHGPGVTTHWVSYLRPRALQRTFYGAGVPDNLRRDPLATLGLLPFPLALWRACAARQARWDALISHWALPSALIAGRVRGARPHIAVLHSADVHLLTRLPARALIAARIAHTASTLWFIAPQHHETFMALLPQAARSEALHKACVSPMGIDALPAERDRNQARAAFGVSRFTVLMLGRLVSIKALDVAIDALAGMDLTLLVAGDGPERGALERLARERNVDARFLSTVTGPAKEDLFAASDAFVMASRRLPDGRSEGVPTALLEAMARGLPCIATQTGGIPSVMQHAETGLLVPPDDRTALSSAVRALQYDADLRDRLGSAAAAATARFSWPLVGALADQRLRGALAPNLSSPAPMA